MDGIEITGAGQVDLEIVKAILMEQGLVGVVLLGLAFGMYKMMNWMAAHFEYQVKEHRLERDRWLASLEKRDLAFIEELREINKHIEK